MVEVEKYIRKLLYEQDCVIIPNFGGLLTHYTAARFDVPAGKYLPSRKRVAFNEVLKMDDGLLSQYISVNEGLSREQAQQCIRDFVTTALSLIRKNKVITLAGIGSFHLNDESRLVFEPLPSRNFHTGFFGLEEVDAAELRGLSKTFTPEIPADESGEEEVVQPVLSGRKNGGWLNWASAAAIAGLVVYVSAVLSQKPGMIDTSSLNPVAAVTTLFQPRSGETREAVPVVEAPAPLSEEVAADIADDIVTEPAPEVIPVSPPAPERRFFIIASVYKSENALLRYGDEVEKTLKLHGFEDVSILEVKDRYMLAAGGYDTWQAASEALPELKKKGVAKGAWIYKVRAR